MVVNSHHWIYGDEGNGIWLKWDVGLVILMIYQ